jgi:hypothetical protein
MSKNFSPNAVNQQTFGAAGFKLISSASGTITGDFVAITALEDVSVTTISATTGDNLGSAITFPAGLTIYGEFTSVNISGGRVIAYYRALG